VFEEFEIMIIDQAIEVLKIEAEGLLNLVNRIDEQFVRMVNAIYDCKGRVLVAGIGKSGIIGRKIVATLNSTGTPSVFLHPVEAVHGDLGLVAPDDVLIALSTSGETDELNMLIPSIQSIGSTVIAFTGRIDSTLAKQSDIVINVRVDREACPLGLAPTASSTALLAMGDALAVTLINRRGFNSSDFKKFHPGGALGQRLSRRVSDIMLTGERIPQVGKGTLMRDALAVVDRMKLGATLVLDESGKLEGIITDGDIRRAIVNVDAIWTLPVESVMTQNPKSIDADTPAYDALRLMEETEITVLPIVEASRVVCGILHLHDILGKGEFRLN
jgi:arabinose-5-phosphate isomerase